MSNTPYSPIPNPGALIHQSHSSEAIEAETYSNNTAPSATMRNKRSINKTRFSETQIKSLESMFETESRLEPVKKVQLATELGLQPRQVAIWFQNKKARWKSKQLEQGYHMLRANYSNLASMFDALKKEHHTLLIQLQKLKDQMQEPLDQTQGCTQNETANIMDSGSKNAETVKNEQEVKPSPFDVEDETGLLNLVEHAGGSLTIPADWGVFDSGDLLGQTTNDYQWWDWDFWS